MAGAMCQPCCRLTLWLWTHHLHKPHSSQLSQEDEAAMCPHRWTMAVRHFYSAFPMQVATSTAMQGNCQVCPPPWPWGDGGTAAALGKLCKHDREERVGKGQHFSPARRQHQCCSPTLGWPACPWGKQGCQTCFWMLLLRAEMRCMSTVGKRAGEGVLQAHHTASQHKQEREPSSCLGQRGQPPPIFRVIPGPMAVMYHPMPALDPTVPLLSCCSHLPCHPASLQPSVLHSKESISLPLYHRLQQITGAK